MIITLPWHTQTDEDQRTWTKPEITLKHIYSYVTSKAGWGKGEGAGREGDVEYFSAVLLERAEVINSPNLFLVTSLLIKFRCLLEFSLISIDIC